MLSSFCSSLLHQGTAAWRGGAGCAGARATRSTVRRRRASSGPGGGLPPRGIWRSAARPAGAAPRYVFARRGENFARRHSPDSIITSIIITIIIIIIIIII